MYHQFPSLTPPFRCPGTSFRRLLGHVCRGGVALVPQAGALDAIHQSRLGGARWWPATREVLHHLAQLSVGPGDAGKKTRGTIEKKAQR